MLYRFVFLLFGEGNDETQWYQDFSKGYTAILAGAGFA